MSILIKGMEMPSCCGGCGFSEWSNLHQTLSCSKHYYEPCFADHSREYMEKRADFCPLIEVPEPHGDLIDRDALENSSKPYVWQGADVIRRLPSAQPEESTEKRTETHACDIGRQAVKHLDLFTKTYCRDKSVKDDLIFRCNQCDFQLPDGTCLVKTMARKLCPDYREFGSMGDL